MFSLFLVHVYLLFLIWFSSFRPGSQISSRPLWMTLCHEANIFHQCLMNVVTIMNVVTNCSHECCHECHKWCHECLSGMSDCVTNEHHKCCHERLSWARTLSLWARTPSLWEGVLESASVWTAWRKRVCAETGRVREREREKEGEGEREGTPSVWVRCVVLQCAVLSCCKRRATWHAKAPFVLQPRLLCELRDNIL